MEEVDVLTLKSPNVSSVSLFLTCSATLDLDMSFTRGLVTRSVSVFAALGKLLEWHTFPFSIF